MALFRSVVAAASIGWMLGAPAEACVRSNEPDLADARTADAVVIGDVIAYERKVGGAGPLGARMTLKVDDVISGRSDSTITIFWPQELNNGPPKDLRGEFLFVLTEQALRGSAVDTDYVVDSDVCTPALVFRRGSASANAIREKFGFNPEPLEAAPTTLSERIDAIPWPTVVAYGLLGFALAVIGLIVFWPRRPGP